MSAPHTPQTLSLVSAPLETEEEESVGVLIARRTIEVAAETEGRLATVDVELGDRVERGARIAAIYAEENEQELAIAQSAFKAAQSDAEEEEIRLRQARKVLERRQSMPELFSAEELADLQTEEKAAKAAWQTTLARVAEQEGRIQQLRSRLEKSTLRAPEAGRIALRYRNPGELVLPGAPIVRIVDSDEFLVRFAISPRNAKKYHLGKRVDIRFEILDLHCGGRVTRIAPQIDLPSQMLFIEARPELSESADQQLQDGLVVRVTPAPMLSP